MDAARAKLRDVLLEARSLVARPGNNFDWSCWEDAPAALREIDGLIGALGRGETPARRSLSVLFAPTGPLQEVGLSSGWAGAFSALADRFDAAEAAFYGR